jgi:hypothetical protein
MVHLPSDISPVDSQPSSRREALKQIAALVGISLSAQALAALSTPANSSSLPSLKFFTQEELLMTGCMAEMIIPETETPGALAAGVQNFIDHYLAECVGKDEQQIFLAGLQKINAVASTHFDKPFLAASPPQQHKVFIWVERIAEGFTGADKVFFSFFKALTLLGYYTSEIGATQELAYLAIPGGYQGNFPFAKIGKAWAL